MADQWEPFLEKFAIAMQAGRAAVVRQQTKINTLEQQLIDAGLEIAARGGIDPDLTPQITALATFTDEMLAVAQDQQEQLADPAQDASLPEAPAEVVELSESPEATAPVPEPTVDATVGGADVTAGPGAAEGAAGVEPGADAVPTPADTTTPGVGGTPTA